MTHPKATAVLVVALIAIFAVTLYEHDPMGLRDIYARLFPANYERQDLSGEDFRGRALAYASFNQAKLREVEFSDANLQFADLRGADFLDTGVSGANFSNALFDGAILRIARGQDTAIYRNASFRNTDLSGQSFHGMGGTQHRSKKNHMMDPGYGGADMSGAIFDGANCRQAIFSRTTLAGASFKSCDCREVDFSDADLRNADFTGADLRGAKWNRADTKGAVFLNAKRD